MTKTMIRFLLSILIHIVYWGYKAEGLNALLLFLPAKMIPDLLRKHGATIGTDVEIHSPLIIHNASAKSGKHYANLHIGNECYLGRDVFLDLKEPISMEARVTISMRATLITHTDVGHSPVSERIPPSQAPIVLREGAYIGASALILQGVEVGSQAIIAAGAVVRKYVPEKQIAAGVPAVLKKNND
jgi:carbonic anhydrase/acetyltransferase-like protein (isoleucine patch superfamily)